MSSKKKPVKEPNTDKDKSSKDKSRSKDKSGSKDKSRSKEKKIKTKKSPLKISKKKKEECKGDLKCLSQYEEMTVEDVYGKKGDVFGNMLIIPGLTPKQEFTPRCRGPKTYKMYKKIDDKKKSGIKLKPLSKSLLKSLERGNSCFLDKKLSKARKELGKTCKQDEDCLSNTCSSIKLLGIKGKCIIPESPNSISEGLKCEYENDCKEGLTCKDKVCVEKKDPLTLAKEKKKNKKSSKGLFNNFLGEYTPKTKKNNKSNNYVFKDDTCLKTEELRKFVEDKDNYVTISKNKKCNEDYCSDDCDIGDFCYNKKCTSINPKCKFSKECLTESIYSTHPTCCTKDQYCKTVEHDEEDVSFCEPLENVKELQNGFYCIKNENCKSQNCDKKINKCMARARKSGLYCKTDKDRKSVV